MIGNRYLIDLITRLSNYDPFVARPRTQIEAKSAIRTVLETSLKSAEPQGWQYSILQKIAEGYCTQLCVGKVNVLIVY